MSAIATIGLTGWLAVAVMSGVFAAIIFPAMKALEPALPAYAAFPEDHWKIAGGVVANRVFRLAGSFELALAGLCILGWVGSRPRGPGARRAVHRLIRLVPFAGALGLLIYSCAVLQPRMRGNLDAFLLAARDGDADRAHALRAAFDADHPTASTALSSMALLVLFTLAAHLMTLGDAPPAAHPGAPSTEA